MSKNPLLQLEIFSNKKKELNNYQVLGSNAEDLRMQIVYTYQQQQEEMEQDQERLLNQFDPLEYPRQVIDSFYGIDYPLNKYYSVLRRVKQRIGEEQADVAKKKKKGNKAKNAGGQGPGGMTTGF